MSSKNTDNEIINSLKNNFKKVEICESFTESDKISGKKVEISLIEDSTDGLQWCAELDYEYKSLCSDEASSCSVPKSIFEGSLIACSNSYATPPSSNYSNHLDVNLAQIDIETFKSEDINAVFLQQTDEECVSICSSFRSINGPELQNSLLFDSNPSDNIIDETIDQKLLKNLKTGLNNDISVDSLDMSLFEKNTSELLQKCSQRDKNNYVIAFEGSLTSSQEFMAVERQKRCSLHNNNRMRCDSQVVNRQLRDSKMSQSEQLSRTAVNRQNERNLNDQTSDQTNAIDRNESIRTLTQSIPDLRALLRINGHSRLPYCPVSGFIPLYDLQGSQSSNSHSSGSEFSPPRSLVKVFMQNRSPFSSQAISPSLSYESASGLTVESPIRPLYYNILEANNNTIQTENRSTSATNATTDGHHITYNDNSSKNRFRLDCHRMAFDLKQTFPIKEVDESMSESSTTDTTPTDLNRNPLNLSKRSKIDSNNSSFTQRMNEPLIEHQSRGHRSASNMRTTSTQFPSHLVDKEVQASSATVGPQPPPISTPQVTPLMTPESPNDCNKPVYVYYPNYSLPDLSFLEDILETHSNCGPKTVYLSPTKHQMPDKESVAVRMRRSVKSKSRPKSFTDFETLSKQNFSHIKDWDSLNILLPNEFKELIDRAKSSPITEHQTGNQSSDCKVRMRSHRNGGQLSDQSSFYSRRGYARNKRYSLQEYPFYEMNEINESESETDFHNSHNSERLVTRETGLTRSQTLPNCRNSCHCHQHCCHSCCHSCCRTPHQTPHQIPHSAAQSPSVDETSNLEINSNSIDRLCQLLAMDLSFKKLMHIISRQNCSTNRSNFETLKESKDEIEFDSHQNTSGQPVAELNRKRSQTQDTKDSHFKQLKQRWESLAAVSPLDHKPGVTSGAIDDKSSLKSRVTTANTRQTQLKPEVARKPQLVLRRPQSAIPRPSSLISPTGTSLSSGYRKSMIPVPKAGLKSPINQTSKGKSCAQQKP